MSVEAIRVYEYSVVCDRCEFFEIYHTGDEDNGVRVHSITSAIKAARFHRAGRKVLCPLCWERHFEERKR